MIRGDMTAGRRPPKERSFKFLQEEINAEWTSFGAEETDVKIHAARVTTDEIAELRKENTAIKRDAKELRVLVATGSAGAHLGQGKGGALTGNDDKSHLTNHGLCLVVACNNDIVSPQRSKNTPTMCMTCWTAFHEGGDASKKLKDGRTVTKTNNAQWPKSVTIAKMMLRFQCQGDDHGEYLEDQQYDFCKAVTIDNGNNYGTDSGPVFENDPGDIEKGCLHDNGILEVAKDSVDIKLSGVVSTTRGKKVFILLDSCAAICAADVPQYFHGGKQS